MGKNLFHKPEELKKKAAESYKQAVVNRIETRIAQEWRKGNQFIQFGMSTLLRDPGMADTKEPHPSDEFCQGLMEELAAKGYLTKYTPPSWSTLWGWSHANFRIINLDMTAANDEYSILYWQIFCFIIIIICGVFGVGGAVITYLTSKYIHLGSVIAIIFGILMGVFALINFIDHPMELEYQWKKYRGVDMELKKTN